jgi:hypothetical protein
MDPQSLADGLGQNIPMDNQQTQAGTIDPDDPLLIAQTLTYVTDNGSIVMSYSSAPFSTCKLQIPKIYSEIKNIQESRILTFALPLQSFLMIS